VRHRCVSDVTPICIHTSNNNRFGTPARLYISLPAAGSIAAQWPPTAAAGVTIQKEWLVVQRIVACAVVLLAVEANDKSTNEAASLSNTNVCFT